MTPRPPKPPGGAMWWQRNPPEGWHFVKNVERAVVMQREWTEAECDFDYDTILFGMRRSKMGWSCCHHDDGATLTLTGGGWGRPKDARRRSVANNDDEYRLRSVDATDLGG